MRMVKSISTIILAAACIAVFTLPCTAGNIRQPAVAGTFYPSDPGRLRNMITDFAEKAAEKHPAIHSGRPLKALIMPHAGYIYSGPVAAYAGPALSGQSFDKIIVMGPDHRVGFSGAAITDADAYQTPLGLIRIDAAAGLLRKNFSFFSSVPASDRTEHSIEATLPFLQVFCKKFKLVPVVMGRYDINAYADAINKIIDEKTFVVVSSDLSHYLPYDAAVARDAETINAILSLDINNLNKGSNRACGIIPLTTLVKIAAFHNWTPVLLNRANSGDTAGNRDRVVGYAVIAFYGELKMSENNEAANRISPEKGALLLELARKTIAERLNIPYSNSRDLDKGLKDDFFSQKRGTFVTLTIGGRLRGCIGNIAPDRSIADGVAGNAANAAFGDPRFAPLTPDEYKKIHIEVSLLSNPRPLEFTDGDDLLSKIRPGVDGLIIRKGIHGATFLPQVWDQLPDKRGFLGHLCQKAGLPSDEWKKPGLKVHTYQVHYVEEKD